MPLHVSGFGVSRFIIELHFPRIKILCGDCLIPLHVSGFGVSRFVIGLHFPRMIH